MEEAPRHMQERASTMNKRFGISPGGDPDAFMRTATTDNRTVPGRPVSAAPGRSVSSGWCRLRAEG